MPLLTWRTPDKDGTHYPDKPCVLFHPSNDAPSLYTQELGRKITQQDREIQSLRASLATAEENVETANILYNGALDASKNLHARLATAREDVLREALNAVKREHDRLDRELAGTTEWTNYKSHLEAMRQEAGRIINIVRSLSTEGGEE